MRVPFLYKLKMFVIFAAAYLLCYVYPNFFGASAVELPLWGIDRAIPFVPWTFIFYTSDYILILIAILTIHDMDRFNSYARMCFYVIFMAGIVFYFFPTTYPRPEYPPVDNWLVAAAMGLVGAADTPRNCFPSMHVALTSAATWGMRYKGRGVFTVFVIWSVAIFVSTLTTKQHYFVDILGGLAVFSLAGVLDWLFFQKGLLRTRLKLS